MNRIAAASSMPPIGKTTENSCDFCFRPASGCWSWAAAAVSCSPRWSRPTASPSVMQGSWLRKSSTTLPGGRQASRCLRLYVAKAQLGQIKLNNKDINRSDRNHSRKPLGKQSTLTAVIANDKARHRILSPNRSYGSLISIPIAGMKGGRCRFRDEYWEVSGREPDRDSQSESGLGTPAAAGTTGRASRWHGLSGSAIALLIFPATILIAGLVMIGNIVRSIRACVAWITIPPTRICSTAPA